MTTAKKVHVKCHFCKGHGSLPYALNRNELASARREEAHRLRAEGMSLGQIAGRLKVTRGSVQKMLRKSI